MKAAIGHVRIYSRFVSRTLGEAKQYAFASPVKSHVREEITVDIKTWTKVGAYLGLATWLVWDAMTEKLSLSDVAIIVVLVVILHWAIPSKFDRNFGTFEILFFWAGFPAAMIVENMLGEVPMWTVWTWLGLSLVASLFFPFTCFRFFRKFSLNSFH